MAWSRIQLPRLAALDPAHQYQYAHRCHEGQHHHDPNQWQHRGPSRFLDVGSHEIGFVATATGLVDAEVCANMLFGMTDDLGDQIADTTT